jgi:hypothetical protein
MDAKDKKGEPYNFSREYVGLNDEQIQAIRHSEASISTAPRQ